MKINLSLTSQSFTDARKIVRAYQKSLKRKCETFVSELADKGIAVAQQNVGGYGKYIIFSKEFQPSRQTGATCILTATQTGLIRSQWRTTNNAGGIATADVSPLLMVEFGAGINAKHKNPKARDMGMGVGTFPGQTHAFDPDGWWYMDMDWEWHHVKEGVDPGMPMYNAAQEMEREIFATAKGVFG